MQKKKEIKNLQTQSYTLAFISNINVCDNVRLLGVVCCIAYMCIIVAIIRVPSIYNSDYRSAHGYHKRARAKRTQAEILFGTKVDKDQNITKTKS